MEEGLKFDKDKLRVDLVPPEAIEAIAQILTDGAKKYGEKNWEKGIKYSRVYGAAMRHLLAFWKSEDIDRESGQPHLYHALTNLAFLVAYHDWELTELDDRKGEDDDEQDSYQDRRGKNQGTHN